MTVFKDYHSLPLTVSPFNCLQPTSTNPKHLFLVKVTVIIIHVKRVARRLVEITGKYGATESATVCGRCGQGLSMYIQYILLGLKSLNFVSTKSGVTDEYRRQWY
jgi:hypothetical protein